MAFYNESGQLLAFKPSVKLLKNDVAHLKSLLEQLKSIDSAEVLTYLRQMIRFIEHGIKHALSLIIHPLVQFSSDLVGEKVMETCIGNGNDARIFIDALCWAEQTSPAILCTQDYSDLVNKRGRIYATICKIRPYDISQNPLKIRSLTEIIPG
jgi:hypothetical protein